MYLILCGLLGAIICYLITDAVREGTKKGIEDSTKNQ